jgi:putative SOS response-associated peptidase YedK
MGTIQATSTRTNAGEEMKTEEQLVRIFIMVEYINQLRAGAPDHRYVRWGLVPFFAKAEPGALPTWKFPTFNARSEELEAKPSFRHTLASQRCLVLINGFYEWTGEKGRKTPHYIFLPNHEPFAIAGLWDRWSSKDGSF